MRRRRQVRLPRGCSCLLAAVLAVAIASGLWVRVQLQPVGQGPAKLVRISRGATIEDTARALRRQNLIRHAGVFVRYARWRGDAARIRAGRYRISPRMSPGQILDKLVLGRQDLEGLVVIPEGFTVRKIAERLKAARIIRSAEEFEKLARNPGKRIRAPFLIPSVGLEGYLFPTAYDFEEGMDPAQVLQAMVDAFGTQFLEPYAEEIRQSPHSLHEIVTIAAMIEREAVVDKDRPLIAGVIENRLRKGMPLQIDATVLYALGYHKSRVLYKDLKKPSPYNTYLHKGLPPGPIASPGLPSLLAALRPARHDYLYYVAAPDRTHIFTRTLEEHNAAIARLRKRRAAGQGG